MRGTSNSCRGSARDAAALSHDATDVASVCSKFTALIILALKKKRRLFPILTHVHWTVSNVAVIIQVLNQCWSGLRLLLFHAALSQIINYCDVHYLNMSHHAANCFHSIKGCRVFWCNWVLRSVEVVWCKEELLSSFYKGQTCHLRRGIKKSVIDPDFLLGLCVEFSYIRYRCNKSGTVI